MATVTNISAARERRAFDHALLRQQVRIRTPKPCLYRSYHLPFVSLCIFCWPLLQPDPYSGKEGIVRGSYWDTSRGKMVFEIWFEKEEVSKEYLNGDFDLVESLLIAHNRIGR